MTTATTTPSTLTREVPLGPGRVYATVDTGCHRSMVLLGTMTASTITMLIPKPTVNIPSRQSYVFPIQSTSLTTDGEHMLREMAEEFRRREAADKVETRPVSYRQQQRELPRFLRKRGRG